MDPSQLGYDETRTKSFYEDLENGVRALPGVESATLALSVPLGNSNQGARVYREPTVPTEEELQAFYNVVDPDYFQTMKIALARGRTFTLGDNEAAPRVAVVNEALAGRLWPGQDPSASSLVSRERKARMFRSSVLLAMANTFSSGKTGRISFIYLLARISHRQKSCRFEPVFLRKQLEKM
jgi:MacB-like periplasmic core domain